MAGLAHVQQFNGKLRRLVASVATAMPGDVLVYETQRKVRLGIELNECAVIDLVGPHLFRHHEAIFAKRDDFLRQPRTAGAGQSPDDDERLASDLMHKLGAYYDARPDAAQRAAMLETLTDLLDHFLEYQALGVAPVGLAPSPRGATPS